MMRRLFLQATLVCMLIALLATPASAGLTTDPLGAAGVPPANLQGAGPGGGPHIHPGTLEIAPAHIYPGNPEVAPAQIFPGAPEIGDVNGDGYRDADGDTWGSGADTLQGGPALAVAPPIAPGPQIVCLDGGCDDDQLCGGMDDDQLLGGDEDE